MRAEILLHFYDSKKQLLFFFFFILNPYVSFINKFPCLHRVLYICFCLVLFWFDRVLKINVSKIMFHICVSSAEHNSKCKFQWENCIPIHGCCEIKAIQ